MTNRIAKALLVLAVVIASLLALLPIYIFQNFPQPRRRVAAGLAKSLAVFILAYGAGAIVAFIVTPMIAPSLTFLAIVVYGPITALFLLINAIITFPIMLFLLKKTNTGSIDT